MRILLTGKNGQLGSCFQEVVRIKNVALFAYSSAELDITNVQQVALIVSHIKPDIIVNAAAYTAVDKAESDVEAAYLVNATGPRILAEEAVKQAIPLIHVSTDYVFDGEAVEPYRPNDVTNPQGVYGLSKLAGEKAIVDTLDQYIILRTSWVFSEYGNNFVKTMVRLAKERDSLNVVADQYGCPTYAGDLAKVILQLCATYQQKGSLVWGTYHCCGDTPISWHGFARAIFVKAHQKGLINRQPKLTAISSDQYPTPVKRPTYSVLDQTDLSKLPITRFSWLQSLDRVLGLL